MKGLKFVNNVYMYIYIYSMAGLSLRPAIEYMATLYKYMATLYKYMTTVPKVNNKDWRISMNTYRVCTSPLERAEFSADLHILLPEPGRVLVHTGA